MIMLGIETATEYLSAALLVDNVIYERSVVSQTSHCELLAGFILDLTDEAGIAPDGIECVSVSTGPGSFTGLRIGIATAMGLAYGLVIPVCGIGTLEGLAYSAGLLVGQGMLVCPVIDAKRSEAYTAVYRTADGIPETVMKPVALPAANLAGRLAEYGEPVIVTGPAITVFKDIISKSPVKSVTFAAPESAHPSARFIAGLGIEVYRGAGGLNPAQLEPIYLRRSDAEILRDSKQGEAGKCR